MNALEICRVLLSGSVANSDVPELQDEEIQQEVERRLAESGCELKYSREAKRWLARLAGPLPDLPTHDTVLRLDQSARAVLAAAWLHLRFLAVEREQLPVPVGDALIQTTAPEPAVEVEDFLAQFKGRYKKAYLDMVLSHLKRAGFIDQRDGRLFAGPLLDTIDDVAASEKARQLLFRHQRIKYLRERAAEITAPEASSSPLLG